jgi:flagellar basal body L-ring protein FlgH
MKTAAIATLFVLGAMTSVHAQSLLQGEGAPNDPPKKPGLKRHDHVQIQFADASKSEASGDAARRAHWDKELKEWVRADGKSGAAGSTITAEVVDIRPNGALVLQATKRRSVNQDQETVRLTCEVAAENVAQNRTSSSNLVNLTMTYEGNGAEGAKPGMLGWLFGKIWPF